MNFENLDKLKLNDTSALEDQDTVEEDVRVRCWAGAARARGSVRRARARTAPSARAACTPHCCRYVVRKDVNLHRSFSILLYFI